MTLLAKLTCAGTLLGLSAVGITMTAPAAGADGGTCPGGKQLCKTVETCLGAPPLERCQTDYYYRAEPPQVE